MRDGVRPCLAGDPQDDSLCIFLLPLPSGASEPPPRATQECIARKPELCGLRAPHVASAPPGSAFASRWALCFLSGRRRGRLRDLRAMLGGLTLPRRRRSPTGAHPGQVWRALAGPQLTPEWLVPESDSEAHPGGTCPSRTGLGDCGGGPRPATALTLRVKGPPPPPTHPPSPGSLSPRGQREPRAVALPFPVARGCVRSQFSPTESLVVNVDPSP